MKRIKILFRKNLKMSLGKTVAQAGHAILALNDAYEQEIELHASIVTLGVSDAKFEEAKKLHKQCVVIADAGYTEVKPGTETCLAFLEDDPRT